MSSYEEYRKQANALAAQTAANWVSPGSAAAPKPGVLKEKVIECPVTGRKSREFEGDKSVWMNEYKSPRYLQVRINNNPTPNGSRSLSDFISG